MDNIPDLRKEIAELDKNLLRLLEHRFALVKKVWNIKTLQGLPHRDKLQEKIKIEHLQKNSKLDPEFVKTIYSHIFKQNSHRQ